LQLLAAARGLYVRAAHIALLLRHTRDEFCGVDRHAFFHFYQFSAPDRDIPLNWMLCRRWPPLPSSSNSTHSGQCVGACVPQEGACKRQHEARPTVLDQKPRPIWLYYRQDKPDSSPAKALPPRPRALCRTAPTAFFVPPSGRYGKSDRPVHLHCDEPL
jgi:hypothetical protein